MSGFFTKDPAAVLDYSVNWSAWLELDVLTSSTWAVDPAGLSTSLPSFEPTGKATVWLSGGVEGVVYEVTNHIVTSGGRDDERTIYIQVQDV